jgi:hypothetical protein
LLFVSFSTAEKKSRMMKNKKRRGRREIGTVEEGTRK